MSDAVLEARDLHFQYPGGTPGLDGLVLGLRAGERLALLGPNGCGKTTLLLHLCGVLRPKTGDVRLEGKPIAYTRTGLRALRSAVGTVLQDADDQLFAGTVYQDVSFGPLNLGLPESEVRQRVGESLTAFGIADLADRPPHRLSVGQKKLAALAGAVAMRPRVLLLDEPTAGLDPAGAAALIESLDRLNRAGTQVTMATHDVDLAYAWADRVAVLAGGRVVAEGRPDDVFRRPDALAVAGLRPPWVVASGDALRAAGMWPAGAPVPKTAGEFLRTLGELGRGGER